MSAVVPSDLRSPHRRRLRLTSNLASNREYLVPVAPCSLPATPRKRATFQWCEMTILDWQWGRDLPLRADLIEAARGRLEYFTPTEG